MNRVVSYVLLASCTVLVSACSTIDPLPLNDPAIHVVWPSPPNPPRIKYLREINGPGEIYPLKGRMDQISDFILGDTRSILDLQTPYAVTTNSRGIVYIADTTSGIVHRYDLNAREVSYIFAAGEQTLRSPVSAALDRDENLYLADSVLAKVFKFNRNGEYLRELSLPSGFKRPAGIVVNRSGEKFVVDSVAHKVQKFTSDDTYVGEFLRNEPGEELNTPTHIAVDAKGYLYLTDAMNFVVRVYDPTGKQVRRIGEIGDVPGAFARPKGVAVDSMGNIYVVDANHDNFQIFNQDGKLLLFIGKNGYAPGEFILPSGIHIDDQDRIFIADTFNRRIQVLQLLKSGGANE